MSDQKRPAIAVLWISAIGLGVGALTPAASAHDITNKAFNVRVGSCASLAGTYTSRVQDVQSGKTYASEAQLTAKGSKCTLSANGVPNHDFNATGSFVTPLKEHTISYTIPAKPKVARTPTALTLEWDNGVFLNGVKLDMTAAGCYGVGDGRIGCFKMGTPYRYDPMAPGAGFGADEHNAHTQPDGAYHYHGNPMALFSQSSASGPSPVIGFAADGFPIFGSFIAADGAVRPARSSYQLKSGTRPGGPGGRYDGTFVDDWEYVAGSGDLDECNGMTQDGIYGYVVTDTYPHVMACFTGTPDKSFKKPPPGR